MNPTFIGILAPISWSLNPIVAFFTQHINPILIVFLCFGLFTVLETLRQLLFQKFISIQKVPKRYLKIGVLGIAGFHICYLSALQMSPIVAVFLIANLTSILTIFYHWLFYREPVHIRHKIALIFSLSGILIMAISKGQISFQMSDLLGYKLTFIGANCMAIYSASNREFKDVPKEAFIYVMAISALFCLFIYLILFNQEFPSISLTDSSLILLLTLGPIGYGFFCWNYGMANGNVKIISIIAYINAPLSSLWVVLFGLEAFSIELSIALGLIMIGSAISLFKK